MSQTNIHKEQTFTNPQGSPPVSISYLNWLVFIILSLVWGSSFILMKGGLLFLNAYQVASLRIIFAGVVLLPWSFRHFRSIPPSKIWLVFLSGILGSLLPAYLFCIAEQKIDSGLAGTLNALTPVFVMLTGLIFFKISISAKKLIGIIVAFSGSLLLLSAKGSVNYSHNLNYALLILIATISYGFNANLVHKYLHHIPSIKIASVALGLCALPALLILYFSGFFKLNLLTPGVGSSLLYTAILGVFGTAIATILYFMLVKSSGAVFSSMVTYCIPVVANIWGIIFGETIGFFQVFCLLLILSGVYIANIKINFKPNFTATVKGA